MPGLSEEPYRAADVATEIENAAWPSPPDSGESLLHPQPKRRLRFVSRAMLITRIAILVVFLNGTHRRLPNYACSLIESYISTSCAATRGQVKRACASS